MARSCRPGRLCVGFEEDGLAGDDQGVRPHGRAGGRRVRHGLQERANSLRCTATDVLSRVNGATHTPNPPRCRRVCDAVTAAPFRRPA